MKKYFMAPLVGFVVFLGLRFTTNPHMVGQEIFLSCVVLMALAIIWAAWDEKHRGYGAATAIAMLTTTLIYGVWGLTNYKWVEPTLHHPLFWVGVVFYLLLGLSSIEF